VICPEDAEKFIGELPVEKFYGIGKVTAERMHRLGIHKGSDLKKLDLVAIMRNFGKSGKFFYDIVRGVDDRPVETEWERKSLGTEVTYEKDLTTGFEIIAELYRLEQELIDRMNSSGARGKTVTIKIKFADFRQITRSRTLQSCINDFETLHKAVTEVRKSIDLEGKRIRLLGVSISSLERDQQGDSQLNLFAEL
jgi:DNA polymerase-4